MRSDGMHGDLAANRAPVATARSGRSGRSTELLLIRHGENAVVDRTTDRCRKSAHWERRRPVMPCLCRRRANGSRAVFARLVALHRRSAVGNVPAATLLADGAHGSSRPEAAEHLKQESNIDTE